MNDYTHSGHIHATRRNKETTVEPNYPDDEIFEVLAFVDAIGLLSSFEIARLAGNEDISKNILAKSMEFWQSESSSSF